MMCQTEKLLSLMPVIKLRREIAYESWHMQHLVGQFDDRKNLTGGYGEYYANQIEQHKLPVIQFA
ncbi:hypothetical protein ACNKHM_23235 [Shigella sonnei]